MRLIILFLLATPLLSVSQSVLENKNLEKRDGFFTSYYSEAEGRIYLEVEQLDSSFIYVSSLSQGLGNNDIGLDRGQLGGTRIVHFQKHGNKLLLLQPNLKYRAITANSLERKSVEEAFAKSVLYGFEIIEKTKSGFLIDLTSFLLEDAHGVVDILKEKKQGTFKIDTSRSAINMARTKSFPDNVDFDAIISLEGKGKGKELLEVSPDSDRITVFQHHSFVRLPDDDFVPRVAHINGGSFTTEFMNYSSPISEPMDVKYAQRHRLEKKNPEAKKSEAVEPIIYYLDNGTPEPIRTALLEGARWWNQAFEEIGYIDAFQVKILPDSIDPLDVRYNVIQWVHRSTRGWSYGDGVVDPRTGEIIKGHVSLGSLRVRQDYKIAKALSCNQDPEAIEEFALARIRQLSAHEVGHTLGFGHNFAASLKDRSSVMDYPHPLVRIDGSGLDFSNAYDTGIGEWDKITVEFSYGENNYEQRVDLLNSFFDKGYRYIDDDDARPLGGSNAFGHLWDNGADPLEGLKGVMDVRRRAITNFNESCIEDGEGPDQLEDLFVLLYFYHRYQAEAVVKLIAGREYGYSVKGETEIESAVVSPDNQRKALQALLQTLSTENLKVPVRIINAFTDRAYQSPRGRESFASLASPSYDPLSAASSLVDFILTGLLHPYRVNRLITQAMLDENQLSLSELIESLLELPSADSSQSPYDKELSSALHYNIVSHLIHLARNKDILPQVRAIVYDALISHKQQLSNSIESNVDHIEIVRMIELYFEKPEQLIDGPEPRIPDGSPIGINFCSH